jgi:hypothetical protein
MESWDSTPATLLKKRERLLVDAFNDLLTFKRHVFKSNERKKENSISVINATRNFTAFLRHAA